MKGIQSILDKLAANEAKARADKVEEKRQNSSTAEILMLPVWPEPVRAVPNSILRSALFGAIKRGRRAFLQREKLPALDGITLLFTGPRLDQADLDVWEQCLHIARNNALGTRIEFSTYSFLKAIGRATGGKNVEWLKGAFARLTASVIEIKDGYRAYFGPMLHGGVRDNQTGIYVIEMNPQIIQLYGRDGWTQIEWKQRVSLKGQPLAQWLHSFYSTHAVPFPMKVETIRYLCGSESNRLADFRRELKEALVKVESTTGWTWEISKTDLLHIDRQQSLNS